MLYHLIVGSRQRWIGRALQQGTGQELGQSGKVCQELHSKSQKVNSDEQTGLACGGLFRPTSGGLF